MSYTHQTKPSMPKMRLCLCFLLCTFIIAAFSSTEDVLQSPIEDTIVEGNQSTFYCKYKTLSANPYLYWYVQHTGCSPHFLLLRHQYSKQELEQGKKYSAKLDKESKSISLKISGASVSDSGVYYCALSATVSLSADCTVQEALASFEVYILGVFT